MIWRKYERHIPGFSEPVNQIIRNHRELELVIILRAFVWIKKVALVIKKKSLQCYT
jgi:hypothetical protein